MGIPGGSMVKNLPAKQEIWVQFLHRAQVPKGVYFPHPASPLLSREHTQLSHELADHPMGGPGQPQKNLTAEPGLKC